MALMSRVGKAICGMSGGLTYGAEMPESIGGDPALMAAAMSRIRSASSSTRRRNRSTSELYQASLARISRNVLLCVFTAALGLVAERIRLAGVVLRMCCEHLHSGWVVHGLWCVFVAGESLFAQAVKVLVHDGDSPPLFLCVQPGFSKP